MLTPAINEARTSSPFVIFAKAVSRHVLSPPFLNLFPLEDEMTTGWLPPGVIIAGARPNAAGAAAATRLAAVPVFTNSRRFTFGDITALLQSNSQFCPHFLVCAGA